MSNAKLNVSLEKQIIEVDGKPRFLVTDFNQIIFADITRTWKKVGAYGYLKKTVGEGDDAKVKKVYAKSHLQEGLSDEEKAEMNTDRTIEMTVNMEGILGEEIDDFLFSQATNIRKKAENNIMALPDEEVESMNKLSLKRNELLLSGNGGVAHLKSRSRA
jgi:hypothetical protein